MHYTVLYVLTYSLLCYNSKNNALERRIRIWNCVNESENYEKTISICHRRNSVNV